MLRVDLLSGVVLSLVLFVGGVVASASASALRDELQARAFRRWLLATLGAVSLIITANHLVLLAAAWTLTSLCLHQLLLFFRERPGARLAAHHKFLMSRLADLALWSSFALLGHRAGTFFIDELLATVHTIDVGAPAVLLVLGAALKSAQVPAHGWLIRVMEAPTPVSALLHAGVVNMGGFVLLRLFPVLEGSPVAQALAVALGAVTATVASLTMLTQTSVKAAMAWSTCAQMGFMLLELGLGATDLALLHLVAHSLYKAHAFLSAGGVVERWRRRALLVAHRPALRRQLSAFVALLVVSLGALTFLEGLRFSALFLSLSCAAALSTWLAHAGWRAVPTVSFVFGALVLAHFAAGHVVTPGSSPLALQVLALTWLASFFGLSVALRRQPDSAFARWLEPRLSRGFHLDERFTRLVFRWWPPREARPRPVVVGVEVSS